MVFDDEGHEIIEGFHIVDYGDLGMVVEQIKSNRSKPMTEKKKQKQLKQPVTSPKERILGKVQDLFVGMEYIANLDKRLELIQLHIWHISKRVTVKNITAILEQHGLAQGLDIQRHPELGVRIRIEE